MLRPFGVSCHGCHLCSNQIASASGHRPCLQRAGDIGKIGVKSGTPNTHLAPLNDDMGALKRALKP